MDAFDYHQLPARIVFGAGRLAEIDAIVDELDGHRVMIVNGRSAAAFAQQVVDLLGDSLVAHWEEVAQHVPGELAERARAAATDARVDVVVSVGGGSATGLAKAIALTNDVTLVAIPTTYAGSEQTTIFGVSGEGHKHTGTSERVLPRVVVYDPELTLDLSPAVTAASAFNALAHSVEALYAPGCNPVTRALALEGVRTIHSSLPAVMVAPRDVEPRGRLLYGAWLSGAALGATSAGMHHKICHVLGGAFDLVHADAHSVVLPHVVSFLTPALPDEMSRLALALGAAGRPPAGVLWDLAVASGVPSALSELRTPAGALRADQLPIAAERAAAEIAAMPPPGNPVPVSCADLLALLQRAFTGDRPQ